MWVEFATRNLQTFMSGATNMAYSDKHTAKVAENGTNRIIIDSEYAGKFVVGQTIGIGSLLSTPDIANNRIVSAIEDYGDSGISIVFDGDPVDISVGDVVFTLAWINGSCNAVLSSSGSHVSNTGGKYNCVYRGKESPYGNAFEWIADVLIRREGSETTSYTYVPYFLPDPTEYSGGSITDDYVKLNYTIPSDDGYAKKLGSDSRFPWVCIPSEVGASSSTYYSDRYYYPRSGICAPRAGGQLNVSTAAGPFCWSMTYAPSNYGVYFCARLSYHCI